MPRLLLVRHAESVRHASESDRERPLTAQGRSDAARLGQHVRELQLYPDLALVSPARRARETLEAILEELPQELAAYEPEEALYNADLDTLIGLVSRMPGTVETLLLVGHNPGLCEFARFLVGGESARSLHFPAACLAVIRLPCTAWSEARPGSGKLEHLISVSTSPRDASASPAAHRP